MGKLLQRSPIVYKNYNSPIYQLDKWLDRAQTGLSGLGLLLPPADALNALIGHMLSQQKLHTN